jgi:hypothetical protein
MHREVGAGMSVTPPPWVTARVQGDRKPAMGDRKGAG